MVEGERHAFGLCRSQEHAGCQTCIIRREQPISIVRSVEVCTTSARGFEVTLHSEYRS